MQYSSWTRVGNLRPLCWIWASWGPNLALPVTPACHLCVISAVKLELTYSNPKRVFRIARFLRSGFTSVTTTLLPVNLHGLVDTWMQVSCTLVYDSTHCITLHISGGSPDFYANSFHFCYIGILQSRETMVNGNGLFPFLKYWITSPKM